jgi:hypothetical protein
MQSIKLNYQRINGPSKHKAARDPKLQIGLFDIQPNGGARWRDECMGYPAPVSDCILARWSLYGAHSAVGALIGVSNGFEA